jgi:hypothetical protein
VKTEALIVGEAYEVQRGIPPVGRATYVQPATDGLGRPSRRTVLMLFPERTDGAPADTLESVQLTQIKRRWDDRARTIERAQEADLATRVNRARAALAGVGVDVHRSGRLISQGMAEAIVGPSMARWTVSIELGAFLHKVAPLLEAKARRDAKAAERKAAKP